MLALWLFVMAAGGAVDLQIPSAPAAPVATAAQAPAGAPVTLAEAIARARQISPQRDAAQRRLDAASLANGLQPRLPNPLVELRAENWGAGTQETNPRDTYVTMMQTIELGGKYGARRRDASAAVGVARGNLGIADWTLAGEVVEHYLGAVRAHGTRAVLAEQRASLVDIVRILTERVREGTNPEADLRRFESEQARVEYAVTRVSIALDEDIAALSALLGMPVTSDQLVRPALPAELPARVVDEVAIARRPDVRAAAAQTQRLEALAGIERSLATPDLIVSGGYKGTNNFHTGVAAVGLSIPIFDRNGAGIARAQGDARAAGLDAEFLRRQALAEATARWAAARQLVAQAASVERLLLTPAAVVRTAARSAFVEGTGDVLRLVDAERAYADAARDALDVQLDATLAFIRARLSTGEEPLP